MAKILITGSNGFIGQYLVNDLQENGHDIICTYRHLPEEIVVADERHFSVGNIDDQTQWLTALTDIDCVVHLAARVHVMQETDTDPLASFRLVNTLGTMNLARQAAAAGVERFVYLSSIKVNGEQTADSPFCADDQPDPQDPYAVSKYEAEQQLLVLGKETGLEIVIIRPPLVYGSQVKGNFSRLIKLVSLGFPLPLARINNARSLVNIQNLCSLIQTCLMHPDAAGEIFLVSDGQDVSTSELLDYIAKALDKKNRLFYLPPDVLKWLAYILGRRSEYERLFGSLQLDISKNKALLDWQPKMSVQPGIINVVIKVGC